MEHVVARPGAASGDRRGCVRQIVHSPAYVSTNLNFTGTGLELHEILDAGESGIALQGTSQLPVEMCIRDSGEYDVPIHAALGASSGRPFVVLDLGANVGYFAFRVLDLIARQHLDLVHPDITMVEGNPETFGKLERRIRSRQLTSAGVRMVHGLVGQRIGSALIRKSAVHVKSTIVDVLAGQGVNVAFVDVDTLMKDKAEIDLLKCDIEGAELAFIENYRDLLRKVKYAVFELHHDQCDTGKCMKMLESLGFKQAILRANASFSLSFHSRG